MHNDAFKKETTSKDAAVVGTNNVDEGFSLAATKPTTDRSGQHLEPRSRPEATATPRAPAKPAERHATNH